MEVGFFFLSGLAIWKKRKNGDGYLATWRNNLLTVENRTEHNKSDLAKYVFQVISDLAWSSWSQDVGRTLHDRGACECPIWASSSQIKFISKHRMWCNRSSQRVSINAIQVLLASWISNQSSYTCYLLVGTGTWNYKNLQEDIGYVDILVVGQVEKVDLYHTYKMRTGTAALHYFTALHRLFSLHKHWLKRRRDEWTLAF